MFEGIALPTTEEMVSEGSEPLYGTGNLSGTTSAGVDVPVREDTSENVHNSGSVERTADSPRPPRRHRRVRPEGWVMMGEVAKRMGCSLRTARHWVTLYAPEDAVQRAYAKIFVREDVIEQVQRARMAARRGGDHDAHAE